MLDALKFVQGAVAKKDFVPALTHFQIEGGTIKGYNGSLALSSPIDLDLDVTPNAASFAKAIKTCSETVAMHITPADRLAIISGKFKAFIPCTTEVFPTIEPEGDLIELDGDLMDSLKALAPFVGQDASRPWALGMLFKGHSAFATNNIVIVERWLGYQFPVDVNIPAAAIKELLRIGKEPISIQVAPTSITFHFENERWLKSQVSTLDWPDLTPILEREANQIPVYPGLFEAVESLIPFIGDEERLYFLEGVLATAPVVEDGASIEIPGLPLGCCFNAKQLLKLNNFITTVDFSQYPAPCLFFGDNIRGAIVGMRV
jgi:DNA polymerase III sliding clamp (beta) subunit (PCNA family)